MEFSLSNGNILKILLKIIPNTTTKKPFIIIFQPIEYTILLSFFHLMQIEEPLQKY